MIWDRILHLLQSMGFGSNHNTREGSASCNANCSLLEMLDSFLKNPAAIGTSVFCGLFGYSKYGWEWGFLGCVLGAAIGCEFGIVITRIECVSQWYGTSNK